MRYNANDLPNFTIINDEGIGATVRAAERLVKFVRAA